MRPINQPSASKPVDERMPGDMRRHYGRHEAARFFKPSGRYFSRIGELPLNVLPIQWVNNETKLLQRAASPEIEWCASVGHPSGQTPLGGSTADKDRSSVSRDGGLRLKPFYPGLELQSLNQLRDSRSLLPACQTKPLTPPPSIGPKRTSPETGSGRNQRGRSTAFDLLHVFGGYGYWSV